MVKESLRTLWDILLQAYNVGDYEKIADMYTEDAVIVSVGFGTFEGREGVLKYYRGAREKVGIESFTLEMIASDEEEELTTEFGKTVIYGENMAPMGGGHYMVQWKSVDGKLKIYRDLGL